MSWYFYSFNIYDNCRLVTFGDGVVASDCDGEKLLSEIKEYTKESYRKDGFDFDIKQIQVLTLSLIESGN